jgi:hypothetical protein
VKLANLYHDVARNVANLNTGLIRAIFSGDFSRAVGKGFSEWSSDWQKVVSGDVPIEMVGGRPVVDLSPLQRGVFCAPSVAMDLGHRLRIDNLLPYQLAQETVHLAHGDIGLRIN